MKTTQTLLIGLLTLITFYANSQQSDYTYNKQPTYQDALRLEKIIEENKTASPEESKKLNADFYGILGRYGIDSSSIKGNPFLMDYKFRVNTIDTPGVNTQTSMTVGVGSSDKQEDEIVPSSSVPMNWEAAAINGIATFMAGRFKQEVLHMGIHQMFKRITDRDSTLLADLFPKTFAQIVALRDQGTDAYYTADLLYLRELVNIDLQNLSTNLVVNIDDIFPKLDLNPTMKDGLLLTTDLVKYSEMGVPVDQLLTYASSAPYSSDSSLISQMVNISDLLSQAFRDTKASGRIWVNPLVTLPHTGDPRSKDISKIFYGLLYSQLIDLKQFEDAFEKITREADNIEAAHKRISEIIQSISMTVNKLQMLANLIKENNYEIKNVSQAMGVIDELIEVVESTSSTLNLFDINTAKIDTVTTLAHDFVSFSESLIAKNYRAAIPKLVLILGTFSKDQVEMSRILGFIAGLGEINNDEDMEKLLQAYALPIGSASIKRSSAFNLSVNSYVGFTGGIERAFALHASPQDKWNVGLTAPIGISMTFGNGYVTLFASVIDLGSIVNQRINNDTTSYVDLRFEHFFAPGASLLYNVKNTPISIGAGVTYIPNLRTIKYSDGTATVGESGLNVLRINASVLIDIPFFTIYNRPLKSEWVREQDKKKRKAKRNN